MPEWIWHWSGYAVALAACVGVVWALFWDRPRGRRRCRGCWYDMSGASGVPVKCPECGRAHAKPRHLTRTRRRWVSACAVLLVMVVGGYGLWVVPRVQDEGWVGLVPTTAMVILVPGYFSDGHAAIYDDPNSKVDEDDVFLLRSLYDRWRAQPAWSQRLAVRYWLLMGWHIPRDQVALPFTLLESLIFEAAVAHRLSDSVTARLVADGLRAHPSVLVAPENLEDEHFWQFRAFAGVPGFGGGTDTVIEYEPVRSVEGSLEGKWVRGSGQNESSLFVRPSSLSTLDVQVALRRDGEVLGRWEVTYPLTDMEPRWFSGEGMYYEFLQPGSVRRLPANR